MNKKAYYGEFGGQFVSESLMNTLKELDDAFEKAIRDESFMKEYHYYLEQYVGRETPLYFAERLSEKYGTRIYLKRGLKPHRSTQDQQRDRSDPACKANGQKESDRRDRSRSAWCRNRDRSSAVRYGVYRLYG